jgi:hypothetical protein
MKELVWHIRAVHFALAICSIALLAAGLSKPSSSAEQALADAMLLRDLSQAKASDERGSYKEEQSDLSTSIMKRVAKDAPKVEELDIPYSPSTIPGTDLRQYEPWIEVKQSGKIFFSPFPGWFYVDNKPKSDSVRLDDWNSLEDFVHYWNSEPAVFIIRVVGNSDDPLDEHDALICNDNKARAYTILSKPREASGKIEYTVEHDTDSGYPYVQGHLNVDGIDCTIPFEVDRSIDVREMIAERLQELGKRQLLRPSTDFVPIAGFDKTFRDLDVITTHTKELKWSNLIPELHQRADESRSPIEMWGARIPGWLGIVILLATQLYLVLHCAELQALAATDPRPLPSGYIGLYSQPVARIVASTTLIFLPVAAIVIALNGRQGLAILIASKDRQELWITAAVALASALLGSYAVYYLSRLRSTRKAVPEVAPSSAEVDEC